MGQEKNTKLKLLIIQVKMKSGELKLIQIWIIMIKLACILKLEDLLRWVMYMVIVNITVQALLLAKVIPNTIFPYNVDKISWCGGDTWVIQLGDQIDRCRPDNWKKNCIEDFNDVVEDEGNNMMIIQLWQKLDAMAKPHGGRVLGMIGNHELMNIDRDFRYVSPQEFLEFVPPNERNRKYTDDGYPYGYYHRLKVFERGGNIAKHYAIQKKSIKVIGKNLFVHGGLSHSLMSKYSIHAVSYTPLTLPTTTSV